MSTVTRKKSSEKIFSVFNAVLMILLMIAILYPMLNMISISVSDDVAVMTNRVTFYPIGFDLDAYSQILTNRSLITSFGNTFFVAVISCILSLLLDSFAAYPLAYSDFIGKKLYTGALVFTMWFGGGIIATYLVVRNIGLLDSLWAVILTSLLSAYHVIVLRAFFETIPFSLVESARIDGANDFRILFQIIWPLSKPALAMIALWVIVAQWNSYLGPLIYLNDIKKYTLQLVLRDIVLNSASDLYGLSTSTQSGTGGDVSSYSAISEQMKNAVVFVSMIPMLILYPFLQKYFVKGIMLGAVKE
jgi:ABC-type glycerol-3-phosphate transport system permease component